MSGAPPYMVQAHRPGQHVTWYTDARLTDLSCAIEHARRLHRDYSRKVRIIDQDERVYLRLPSRPTKAVKS